MLTEGALIGDDELSATILMTEELLAVADKELENTKDEIIETWAQEKISIMNETLEALYGILEHKTQRKLETGTKKICGIKRSSLDIVLKCPRGLAKVVRSLEKA